MANQNDSFIDEVTDELRRDRLYGVMRRYGWIVILVILAIVGATAWREYSRGQERAEAQAWGDAVLAAEEGGDPAALLAIDPQGSAGREALAGLLAAGLQADEPSAAAEALRTVGGDQPQGALAELAQLKLVMLDGPNMDPSTRDEMLTRLSRAGAPFELLALEQKAVALIGAGRPDDAVTLIRQIQDKDGVSQALRLRLSEMMIALGVDPEPADMMPPDMTPADMTAAEMTPAAN
ncbi:tetratricopeptide repeat protein [Paracoccus gahaiensis]|uniref:Tetratricopeptide repeat protein n=1 Tax=Paracoccus gahaiensis TaxID=1706839 RepID=A0A4V5MV17_9RHOB|nr:tetratricopeptide repeat protein [Paracoccus gahaiensis]TJZ90478.1 tetratricopeptide repeat protein [Paracoccus gahaiensis]